MRAPDPDLKVFAYVIAGAALLVAYLATVDMVTGRLTAAYVAAHCQETP